MIQTLFRALKSPEPDVGPSMASATMVLASDFDVPGLPMINNGIRSSIQTTIMKTFSFNAALHAILDGRWSSFINAFWQLKCQISLLLYHK